MGGEGENPCFGLRKPFWGEREISSAVRCGLERAASGMAPGGRVPRTCRMETRGGQHETRLWLHRVSLDVVLREELGTQLGTHRWRGVRW